MRTDSQKPKYYALIEFPYPSGEGLHVGHARPYTAMDIVARKRRREGYNVLFPMGWDAFGLPTEKYAIKNKIHPAEVTRRNVERFRSQCDMLGYSFDWSREVNTTDPEYYKWTQWIFLKLFEHGLAYKAKMPVNWCTSCKCVLANEEVVNGVCERCGTEVVRREKEQWMLKITEYADKLLDGLDEVDYPERVKIQQRNWIGRSTGAEVISKRMRATIRVFTTRPDTLFGDIWCSRRAIILKKWADRLSNIEAIRAYRRKPPASRTSSARAQQGKDGVRLEGVTAINPVNGASIPIFVSDYTHVIRHRRHHGRSGHDTRDWSSPRSSTDHRGCCRRRHRKRGYTDVETGTTVTRFPQRSEVSEAQKGITEWLHERGLGKPGQLQAPRLVFSGSVNKAS